MDSQVLVALALSLVGGMSTSLGALFVIINQAPNLKMLGILQGFAAGLMLSISFLDLAHNAMNSIGFLKGNLWFFAGVIFFAVVANFIPEPTLAPVSDVKSKKKTGDEGGKDIMKKHRRQVLFSGIISAIDDAIIFCDADLDQLQALRVVLLCSEIVSGLKVNLGKSEMVPLGVVCDINSLTSLLGCKGSSLPLKYFGLPLGAPFKANAIWDGVEKVEKRLAGWKRGQNYFI